MTTREAFIAKWVISDGRNGWNDPCGDLYDYLLLCDALPGRERKEHICSCEMGWHVNRVGPYILRVSGLGVGVVTREDRKVFYGTL